jgi:hypothetical protein
MKEVEKLLDEIEDITLIYDVCKKYKQLIMDMITTVDDEIKKYNPKKVDKYCKPSEVLKRIAIKNELKELKTKLIEQIKRSV